MTPGVLTARYTPRRREIRTGPRQHSPKIHEEASLVNQGWTRFFYRGNCYSLHRGNPLCRKQSLHYVSRRGLSMFHRGGGCQGLPTSRNPSKLRHRNQRYWGVAVTPRRPAGIVSRTRQPRPRPGVSPPAPKRARKAARTRPWNRCPSA
jgi:hypothetical protein